MSWFIINSVASESTDEIKRRDPHLSSILITVTCDKSWVTRMACQRFRSDRGRTRGNRHRGAVNVCDRSGRSPVGRTRFAGWKRRARTAGRMLERPSGGGTAGVVRWLARTRQAVHLFTRWPLPPPSLPAAPSPSVATCMHVQVFI